MIINRILPALLIIVSFSIISKAQVCQPNIDFEDGVTTPWHTYTGTCCPISTPTETPLPVPNRHTITTGTAVDPYGGFPIVAPGAGAHSLRLGNSLTGHQAEKIRYYIHVPASVSNYSLVYRYAIVLQDFGHGPTEQPRFQVSATDSATGSPIICADYNYIATSGLPGFFLSPCTTCMPASTTTLPVWVHDWATASLNLSGLGGTTVIVDFATGDCSLGGHFGYAYVDMQCGLFQVSTAPCDTSVPLNFSAPPGFDTYTWYDSTDFTTPVGTTQSITLSYPLVPTTYAVIMHPFDGFGCEDTLYTHVIPAYLALHPSNDTTICRGRSVTLSTGATDIAYPLTFSWAPSTGLSCTGCATPIASPIVTTVYTVSVTDAAGCTGKDSTMTVTVLPDVGTTLTTTDATCFGYANGSATLTVTSGTGPFLYIWTTSPPITTPTATGLTAGSYSVVVTNIMGCTDTSVAVIGQPAATILNVVGSTNPTRCLGTDGTITIGGLLPGITFTFHYYLGGVPQTATLTADASGQVVLGGLAQGTYGSITVIGTLCPYNTIGPVVLNDPPNPDLTGVTSKDGVTGLDFICAGNPIQLFSYSSVPGVSYSWTGPSGFSSVFSNPVINPGTLANAGLYTVTVSINNCFTTTYLVVDVRPLPIPSASCNTPLCTGDTARLMSSSANGAETYIWQGPNVFYTDVQNPLIGNVLTTQAGVYTVTVTKNGCKVAVATTLDVNVTPDPPLTHDTDYCQYDLALPFYADGVNLKWYTDPLSGTPVTTTPTPSTTNSGNVTWYVTQSTAANCTSKRSKVNARIWTYPAPYLALTDSVSCQGKYITFTAQNIGEGSDGLTWGFGSGDSLKEVNPVYRSFGGVGTFTISASAYYTYCRDTTVYKTINIFPYPIVNLGADTSICPGSNALVLNPKVEVVGGIASYKWNTGETTPKIQVVAPGIYYATVSVNGCQSIDSIIVSNDCYLNLPNVFTPNGDGINDYFFPRQLLTRGLTSFSMNIYNRWGQQIFSTNTIDGRGWDGSLNGTPQPEGVFVYVIDATFKDGQIEHHQGNVTLLR